MKRKGFLAGSISIATLIGIWFLGARVTDSPFILPDPVVVMLDLIHLPGNPSFLLMTGATAIRGLIAFAISVALASVLGFFSGVHPTFGAALRPWMSIIKSTPVVSFILIALLWFGSSVVPVFVAVLMTLPVMTEAIAQGIRSCDPKLLEMGKIYRFSKKSILFNIQLPSAIPFFLGGANAALGLTWKVVVAGEILGSPRNGIGTAMQTAKIHLETARVFSLTITAIILCVITELLFDLLIAQYKKRNTGLET